MKILLDTDAYSELKRGHEGIGTDECVFYCLLRALLGVEAGWTSLVMAQ